VPVQEAVAAPAVKAGVSPVESAPPTARLAPRAPRGCDGCPAPLLLLVSAAALAAGFLTLRGARRVSSG